MPNVDDPLASLRLAYLEDLSDESPEDYEEESAGYVDDRARTMPREDRVKSVADHQGSSNMHRSSSSSLSKLPFPVKLPKTSKIAAASSVRPSRESLASQSSLVRSVEETSSPQEHRTRYPPATVQEASDKFRLSEKDCPAELGKPAITEHSQSGSLGKGARPKSRGQVVLLASEDPIEGD